MFRIELGRTDRYCDGVNRRSFLQLGVAGMAGLGLPQLLRAKAESARGKPTSVILIWLDGGPGHMDTYDMKPDAPEEYRGLWKPIPTSVPGFRMTELFPKQAKVADKFSVVRSLRHGTGDHFAGMHRMLTGKDLGVATGNLPAKAPSIGSVASYALGSRRPGLPAYAVMPDSKNFYLGSVNLGGKHAPFMTGGDPNKPNFAVKNLEPAKGLSIDRLEDRRELHRHLDGVARRLDGAAAESVDHYRRAAFDFVTGPAARTAFDIGREQEQLRDRYGRNTWGQSILLARRLVEAGTTFVTAFLGGWDTHWNLKGRMEDYLPKVDAAVSALFEDLSDRGLLETTLVVLCGEFSRTPKMNDGGNGGPPRSMGTPGRDHWGHAMSCLMGGGGVKGGRLIGSTDKLGTAPKDRPVVPSNIHATIYKVLGIDPALQLMDTTGRPVAALDDPAPIHELF